MRLACPWCLSEDHEFCTWSDPMFNLVCRWCGWEDYSRFNPGCGFTEILCPACEVRFLIEALEEDV